MNTYFLRKNTNREYNLLLFAIDMNYIRLYFLKIQKINNAVYVANWSLESNKAEKRQFVMC